MATPQGLPRETFAKLSPHPYLLANLQTPQATGATTPTRSNGRAPHEARTPNVNTSTLTHAHGSALVRVGDNTVICGIRGEILPTANIPNYRASARDSDDGGRAELRDYDLLVPNIELATGSAPQFLPGVPPTTLAQTLSTRVFSLLHSSGLVNADDLRIWHTRPSEAAGYSAAAADGGEDEDMGEAEAEAEDGERVVIAYWVLYIDIYFISFDGNPFDAAWAAMLAALRNTKLPAARWDVDREIVLCSRAEQKPLTLSGFPIATSAAVFQGKEAGQFWTLVDPDRLEETLCREGLTVVVDKSAGETKLLAVSKHGGTTLQPKLVGEFVAVAEKRWEEFRRVIT
ncbi:hypothetical protein ACHAQA_006778 [Verticillium albo-atrum]